MSKIVPVRRAGGEKQSRSALSETLAACLVSSDLWDSLETNGYASMLDSPDVAAAAGAVADVVSSATIHLMRNTADGDVREKSELSRFMDIHPYSLGTRKTFVSWIVLTLLTAGDGNAFVLPVTRDGYLEDLVPMPGAFAVGTGDESSYTVSWRGRVFSPDQVLHFVYRPSIRRPWMGRGVRVQLKDVLKNLRQAAATTNAFLSNNWKPSVIVKVDALADEFSSPSGRQKLLDQYIKGQKAGEPWVIPADLMDVIQVKPLSLADLAISSNVELDKRSVAAAVGVPPFLIGVMYDREPLYPGRVKLTPVSGQSNVYDMVRADQPAQAGSPLNKNTFLKDTTAALFGKTSAALPDEIFQILANAALYKDGEIVTPGGISVPNVQMELGSYIGTGTYGENNPTVISFSIPVDIVIMVGQMDSFRTEQRPLFSDTNNYAWLLSSNILTTDFTRNLGLGSHSTGDLYGKKSSDNKNFYSYNTRNASYQMNDEGQEYFYAGIGLLGG